jgi:transcriptional regulator with XRE-family HTH domain
MPKRGRPKGRSNDSRSFGPLGDLIRRHRLEKSLGLLDVANSCNCSVQFISNIEHGRAPLPWEKAPLLAACLGISLETLQAANLSVRSDFKSFVSNAGEGANSAGAQAGISTRASTLVRGKVLRAGRKSVVPLAPEETSQAMAMAIAIQDSGLRELLEAYQAATIPSRKKFVKSAIKLLQAD